MASKYFVVVVATRSVIGDLDNHLLVFPVLWHVSVDFEIARQYASKSPKLSSFVDGEYHAYENSLLAKLITKTTEK